MVHARYMHGPYMSHTRYIYVTYTYTLHIRYIYIHVTYTLHIYATYIRHIYGTWLPPRLHVHTWSRGGSHVHTSRIFPPSQSHTHVRHIEVTRTCLCEGSLAPPPPLSTFPPPPSPRPPSPPADAPPPPAGTRAASTPCRCPRANAAAVARCNV